MNKETNINKDNKKDKNKLHLIVNKELLETDKENNTKLIFFDIRFLLILGLDK